MYVSSQRRDEEFIIKYNFLAENKPLFVRNQFYDENESDTTLKQIKYDCIMVFKGCTSDVLNIEKNNYYLVYSNSDYLIYECRDGSLKSEKK